MDIERFQLTDKEMALVNGDKDACLEVIKAFDTCEGCSASCRAVAKAQVAKLLSMLEPVELETLENEDIIAEYESWADITPDDDNQLNGLKGVSQATIQKNQKGQLYRVKEEKDGRTSNS